MAAWYTQEQVMQIVTDLAGYSMGRADLLRDAMSKKFLKLWRRKGRISSMASG